MTEIYFFNVGQGDSILIKFPNNRYGIIDCNYTVGSKVPPLLKALINLKVKHIAFICISHPHADHYRGFKKVLNYLDKQNIPVDYLIDFGISDIIELLDFKEALTSQRLYKKDSLDFKAIYDFANARAENRKKHTIKYRSAIGFDTFLANIGKWDIRSYAPLNEDISIYRKLMWSLMREKTFVDDKLDHNILSSLIRMERGSIPLLFGGDVFYKNWERATRLAKEANKSIHAGILKVSHHGSLNSYYDAMFKDIFDRCTLENRFGVISCGSGIKKLPHEQVIDQLIASNVIPLCTNMSKACSRKNADIPGKFSSTAKAHLEGDKYQPSSSCYGNILIKIKNSKIDSIITDSSVKCSDIKKHTIKFKVPLSKDEVFWKNLLH